MSPPPDYVAELALIEMSKLTRPMTLAEAVALGGKPGDVPKFVTGDMPPDNPRDEHGRLRPKKDVP